MNKLYLSLILLFIILSISGVEVLAENIDIGEVITSHIKIPVKPKKIPIEISGDKLEIEPNDTYIVTGNVMVKQGSTEIYCDKGTYNERTGLAQAIHNVRVKGTNFTVKCRRLDSHTKENFSIFSGNVKIIGEKIIAFSKKANYYEKEEKLILIGNPRAESKDDPPNVVTGRRIIYYFHDDRAKVVGNVIADIQPKKNMKNSSATHITGEKLSILSDGRYQVEGNLVATKNDTTLYADRGIYNDTQEITEAFGNVKVVNPKYMLKSGYLKNYSLEDRTIASVDPEIVQIIDKKNRGKSRIMSGDKDGENKNIITHKKDKVTLKAIQIESLKGGEHIIARGNAFLKQTPFLGDDSEEEESATSTVRADLMDIYSDEGKLVAKGNVEIKGHDITAYGNHAEYYDEKNGRREELRIIGDAKAIQKKAENKHPNIVKGEIIHYYPDSDKIIISGNVNVEAFKNEKKKSLPEITDEVKLTKRMSKEVNLSKKSGEVKLKKKIKLNFNNQNEKKKIRKSRNLFKD